ncbi:MAG: valine--tRNA ligase, partial [Clostridia bacterium]|nr:valine--tRNA ligase [Clostridia bacterium]
MAKQLDKTYDPKSFEDRLYKFWEEKGFFKPSDDRSKIPFSVVIPPPNVTGQLHMGHALNNTMQDIIVRAKRMQGFNTLWIPGTDHAGIATQIKVEAELKKNEGLSRHDIGREKFLEKVWAWKELYGNRIVDQLKKLGSSCDWSRLRFTMDENLSRAVKKTFVSLYDKGLIYRGRRIINFCPRCNTALSDTEVDYKETPGHFWHIRYPFEDGNGGLVVATTRPETMLGDTAVAVHPDDERYKHLVGKNVILPLVNKPIPVIADEYVDMEFGTGCVKITPCHDPNDYEVGLRHDLEMIEVIDQNAKITSDFPKYAGMDRFEAREQIVKDLEACGALVKIEEHSHNVAHCYRCGTIVEPLSSKQWFVKMKPLAEPAIKVVKDGDVKFIPDRFSKNYLNWMENIHDWCISRQLWWGHRIPAFYCDECGEMTVSEDQITSCPKCGAKVRQEEDVLDTWFSSALWPFSTLGWPEKTDDLEYFYPTSVLVTAYDIITFWVSKMIFSGLEQMKEIPFPKVFIHGLVRDALGRKMSKSLGNGIDPLDVIDQYGADALRFTLANGNSPGNDMRFSDEKAQASRNFANKIWNAARFILMNLDIDKVTKPRAEDLLPEDKWIVHSLNRLAKDVTENIDKYELGVAVAKLYDFIWDV